MKEEIFVVVLHLTALVAWFTSLANSIEDGDVFMFIVSFGFFPAGIVHGIGVWFGWG